MEEKKQRNKFYFAWAKGIVIALFLTAVACFSVFAMIFGGLMRQGFSWEELTSNYNNEKNYLETQDCGQRMASQVNKVRNALSDGKPFLTKGKLDKTKLVDITRLDAKTSQQNPATTYTVENLLELKDNGLWDEFQDAIWNAGNGFYEDYYEDDEEFEVDGEYDEDDEEPTSTAEDVDISDYTPRFRYLYNYARDFETVLPESGETLAEYARTNPKKVSLFELYQQLSNAIDQLISYQSAIKMDDKTNVIFMVQNLDNKTVYTNVSEWADGNVDPKSLEDLMEDVPVFVAEREDGKLKDVSDNGTDAGKWIYNYFQNDPVTGKNEKIIVSVDVSFPYSDEISAAYVSYENYAGWGNGLVVGMLISFVAGILFLLIITLQSGLVCRDREVHTMPADRIPAEVMLAICGMALIGMVGIAGLGLTASGNPTDGFWLTVITTGEILGAAVFLGAYLSVIRRWKAKKLWRSSFCYTIVKSCKKVYMARTTSSRMIVAFVGLVLMNYLLAALFGGFGLILLFLADGVVLLYMIRENAGRQVIYDGLARLASGQLDYKIDEKDLTGDNRQMAAAVNRVGEGLQNAVKETLKSERLKADLITNVSHDIKTPLTSIINYVDLLKREDIQDPKIRGYIEVLDNKSKRLKQLTEDLVEASKVSSGNVVLDMKPIRFGELIRQTNGEFEEKFAARGLQMVCKMDEEPLVIMADGRRMWRVVENLYNNIAKYAMPNTRVYVEARRVGCRVVLEIKNISENPLNIKAEELTERFIRGDVSRSTEGSGLGLSIAKNLVGLQGGTFDIYLDGDLFKVVITFEAVDKES